MTRTPLRTGGGWDAQVLGYLSERARREQPTAARKELLRSFSVSSYVLDQILRRLVKSGRVLRVRRGVYQAKDPAP